jgi:ClpP class serine protease
MRATYDQFTDRVMTTRQGKIKDIDAVARGRIFTAPQARDLGMIDAIGGFQDAIAYAAKQADLRPGEYEIRVLPQQRTLADMFNAGGSDSLMPFAPKISLTADSLLRALSPSMRQAMEQQLSELLLLQQRPVILASPVTLIVR